MTDVVMAYQIMNKRCLDWLTAPAQLVSVGRHDPAVLLAVEPRDAPHLPERDAFYTGASRTVLCKPPSIPRQPPHQGGFC